jgi:hypothetical protein
VDGERLFAESSRTGRRSPRRLAAAFFVALITDLPAEWIADAVKHLR